MKNKKYKRFTIRTKEGLLMCNCTSCSCKDFCCRLTSRRCDLEAIQKLAKLEDLIDAGKLIFVDADDDEMVQIKVSRSWLKEIHRILHKKDIDC